MRRYGCEAADQLGQIDILVNNAAVQGLIEPVWEMPWREFEEALRLDFLHRSLCDALIPSMNAIGRGIINIAGGGATTPRPMFATYAPAKAALVRFSETVASRLHTRDPNNAAALGASVSGMTRPARSSAAGEIEAAIAKRQPRKGGYRARGKSGTTQISTARGVSRTSTSLRAKR
jgi:NAD(P)-dependent dehydrogenase (short-subunit alcohol dehydrogenase family)